MLLRSNMCCFWENNVVVFSSIIWYKTSLALAQKAQQLKERCQESREEKAIYILNLLQIQLQMYWVVNAKTNLMQFSSFILLWMLLQYNMNKINTAAHLGFAKDSDTHTDSHPYPLSVSWPRRRTRCTSFWSTVLVNRLAWYDPSPVWPQTTWTAERHTAAHPSSTWASFPDPIDRSGYPSNRSTFVLQLTLWLFTVWTQDEQRDLNLDPNQVLVFAPE